MNKTRTLYWSVSNEIMAYVYTLEHAAVLTQRWNVEIIRNKTISSSDVI